MNTCTYSSLVFLTNVISAYLEDQPVYAVAFFLLTCSSVTFHRFNNTSWYYVLFIIDQICMYMVVAFGGYIFYLNPYDFTKLVSCACFLINISIYKWNDSSDKLHSILHYVASIGHHCLLL